MKLPSPLPRFLSVFLQPRAPTIADVKSVRRFVEFILSCLDPRAKAVIQQLMAEQLLGYRPKTGTIGAILPTPVDILLGE